MSVNNCALLGSKVHMLLTLGAIGCGGSKPLRSTIVTLSTVSWGITSTRTEGAGVTLATLCMVSGHGLS